MSLLLTVYDSPDWKILANATGLPLLDHVPQGTLKNPCALQAVQPLSVISNLVSQLASENHLWLAVVQAEHFLANALDNGITLADAATQWKQQTNALLDLQRQLRRQLKLFNLHQALEYPAALREHLSAETIINEYFPQAINTRFNLLAACQYVIQQPELQALNTRLQASSILLSDKQELTLDIERLLQENKLSLTQLASTANERDTLQQQLHLLKQQLEQSIAEQSKLQQSRQHTESQLQAASVERDLILQQLHQVQEQLEDQNQTAKKQLAITTDERDSLKEQLHQAHEQLEDQKQIAKKQLHELTQQLEQSISEQARLTQNQQHTENQLQTTCEERDLILQQLHQLQEQLESYYLQLQTEQQQHKHALLARDKQHARESNKLESELRTIKARAASAEYAGHLLQQELNSIRGSTLWKTTAPVRVLGRLVKKANHTQAKLLQDTALLLTSEYFDVDWYLNHYPDVAESKMNPAEHYLLYGAKEGRLPGPLFDGNWYLQQYPDVAKAGQNPLLHFVKFGQQEGRSSSPKLLTNNQNAEE